MRALRPGRLVGLVLVLLVLAPPVSWIHLHVYAVGSLHWFFWRTRPVEVRLTLPDGAQLRCIGTEIHNIFRSGPRVFLWQGRSRPAGADAKAEEFVGVWETPERVPQAFAVDGRVVVLPVDHRWDEGTRAFVRTRAGRWKATRMSFFDIADGFEAPRLTAAVTGISIDDLLAIRTALGPGVSAGGGDARIESFSAERAELRVRYRGTHRGLLRLTMSPDGEHWQLTGLERLPEPTPPTVR